MEAANVENLVLLDKLSHAVVLFKRALGHWKVGFVVCLIFGGLALATAMVMPRKYRSEAVLLYRQLIDARSLGSSEPTQVPAREIGARLREIILSRKNLMSIINEFNLYPAVLARQGKVGAVNKMRAQTSFDVREGDVFYISFVSASPDEAYRVTERITKQVIDQEQRLRQEQATATVSFLAVERQRAQDKLLESEKALAQFLAAHPEFALVTDQSGGESGAGTSIRANEARTRTRKRAGDTLSALVRQAARIRAQLSGNAKPTIAMDPATRQALDNAVNDLREAKRTLADMLTQYTERHPDVKAARSHVAAAAARLKRIKGLANQTPRMITATDVDKAALSERLNRILDQTKQLRAGKRDNDGDSANPAADIVALETQWNQVNRQVQESRERYLHLEDRQFRASLQANSDTGETTSQIEVVDPAYKPKLPFGVGRTMIVLAGGAVGALFAGILMLGLSLFDDRIFDRIDVEQLQLAPFLVSVPAFPKKRQRAARAKQREAGLQQQKGGN